MTSRKHFPATTGLTFELRDETAYMKPAQVPDRQGSSTERGKQTQHPTSNQEAVCN